MASLREKTPPSPSSSSPSTTARLEKNTSDAEESVTKRKLGFESSSSSAIDDSATKKSKTADSVNNGETPSEESKDNTSDVDECKPAKRSFSIEAHASEDKGSRHSMEDAWVVLPDANPDSSSKLRCAHFAVYDGHGGRLAVEYAQKHLHSNVLSAGLPLGRQSCQKGDS